MKYLILPVLIGSLLLLGPSAARAVPSAGEMNRIVTATAVFNQMPARIPPYVLSHAQGIAVIPTALPVGFATARAHGYGVLAGFGIFVTRLPDGSWSAPSFISMNGATTDVPIGGAARNVILIFNTPRAVAAAETGNFNLGRGASVTAGPIAANFCGNTVTPDVYSYVSNAGAFIGTTVHASLLRIDYCTNRAVYGMANPLSMPGSEASGPSRNFVCTVSRATGAPTGSCG